MSFGLLTAINVDDIPVILRNCARGWRAVNTYRYPETWKRVAELVEQFANELAIIIVEAKKVEPPIKRERVRL